MYWKLNRILHPVYNLGEGKRIGIWVQGCSLKCPNCISPDLWTTSGGKSVKVENIAEEIIPRTTIIVKADSRVTRNNISKPDKHVPNGNTKPVIKPLIRARTFAGTAL